MYDSVLELADEDDATVYNEATNLGVGDYYSLWDARALAVCECDTPYFSPDCSKSKLSSILLTCLLTVHTVLIYICTNYIHPY